LARSPGAGVPGAGTEVDVDVLARPLDAPPSEHAALPLTDKVAARSEQQLVLVDYARTAAAKASRITQAMRQRLNPRPFLKSLSVAIVRADERGKHSIINQDRLFPML